MINIIEYKYDFLPLKIKSIIQFKTFENLFLFQLVLGISFEIINASYIFVSLHYQISL